MHLWSFGNIGTRDSSLIMTFKKITVNILHTNFDFYDHTDHKSNHFHLWIIY